ncbi:putative NBD/HSP70 family sugar kinase [Bacillus pakistanensis]|uniref:NBD/HSP70 family sugar kinase n=1 Tax=Rossellomorea pakistanensis TaxID=992288 RepID=A0ABS2NGZ0_9BACI|nr:ROK family transcriptional regulator [Bacillus pakistanensis]MBM7587121.1 putative NBD/HSP70 family sugar kinase [Bacillus pakistanensis]
MEKQDQLLMKKQNKNLVLDLIKGRGPISRTEIAKITGMSPTSISRIVHDLHEQGFVRETELVTSGVGRKAVLVDVEKDVLFTIGIDIDKSNIKMAIVNYVGDIIDLIEIQRNHSENYEETLSKITNHIRDMIEHNRISNEKIIGMAVGLPGYIDYKNGVVKLSDQLSWKEKPLAEDLKRLTTFDVVVDNELKMKIISEYFIGRAKGVKNAVLVGVGTGIGSAIILNGEIYRGESNNAGEIGHTVIDPTGNVCNCGKIGCLATYISEGAILADSRKVKDLTSIDDVYEAFRNREQWAINILDRTTTYLALAISNILCLYNPEVIILSGNLFEKLPEIKEVIETKFEIYTWEPVKETVRMVYSQLNNQGVVLGGAIQAQNALLDLD